MEAMSDWTEIYRDSAKTIERRDTGMTGEDGVPIWEERTTYSNPNEEAIRKSAAQALAANRTYLALTSPTNAQTLAQVRALTRQVNALIRLALDDFTEAS
jgi:hypothetical protein